MAKFQNIVLTEDLRNKHIKIITKVEKALDITMIALRISRNNNYIIVTDNQEICIKPEEAIDDVKKLFGNIVKIKYNQLHKTKEEIIQSVEIDITPFLRNVYKPLLSYMEQYVHRPFIIEKIIYDNKDAITCYSGDEYVKLSKKELNLDNTMFNSLFQLFIDEEVNHIMSEELSCVLYLFEHIHEILLRMTPVYEKFVGFKIKNIIYEKNELKLSYRFCTRSFKVKMKQTEFMNILNINDGCEIQNIVNTLIDQINQKLLPYKDIYNEYTKSFVLTNEKFLMLKYLAGRIQDNFDITLNVEYQNISFEYQRRIYCASYHILDHLDASLYSIDEIDIGNGFYNYDVTIQDDEKCSQLIESIVHDLKHVPFFRQDIDYTSQLSKLSVNDMKYNYLANPLYNGLHKQKENKAQYKLLSHIDANYQEICYGVICDGQLKINDKVLSILDDKQHSSYDNAINDIDTIFDELSIDINKVTHIQGLGLLYGETKFSYGDLLLKSEFCVNGGCFKDDYKSWSMNMRNALKDLIDDYQKHRCKAMNDQCYAMPDLFGDILYHDLCEFIIANEACITRKAIIQAMRGTKVQLHVDIVYTNGTGKYNILDEDYISSKIDQLIKRQVIYEHYVKHHQYDFYMIKPNKLAYYLAMERYYTLEMNNNQNTFNDYEHALLLDKMKDHCLQTQDYMTILNWCEHFEFYCLCKEQIHNIFIDCPESVNKMLNMLYSVEKNKIKKKMLKEIIKK